MAKFKIECVRVGDLEAFAEGEARSTQAGSVLAISRCRARAWAANPHATVDDVALIVARLEDGRCAGYLGLVPGRVRVHERVEPVSWLSTLYVPGAVRGYAIGGLLL